MSPPPTELKGASYCTTDKTVAEDSGGGTADEDVMDT